MSVSLTDPLGRRYRILHGWGTGPSATNNLCRGHAEASSFVERLSNEQLSEVLRCFFGGTDHRPRHLRETPVNRSSLHRHAIPTVSRTPAERVAEAICNNHLVVQQDTSFEAVADPRSVLRMEIRQALSAILMSERQEAARHEALLNQETALNKGIIYTGAAMTGLGKAAWGLLCWAKEASDLINPVVRLHNQYVSAKNAWGKDNFAQEFANNQMAAEWREVVEVIGFDPSQVTKQQMAEAMEAADLVWSDATLRQDLKNFAWDYAKAQHAIELTEMGGGAAFEIILTAILAAVTGGVGAIASVASKARHMTKFKKLGELLVDFAKASKNLAAHAKARAKQTAKAAKNSFDDLKTDMPAADRKGEKPKAPEKPKRKPPVKSVSEAKARLAEARKEIIQRRKAGLPEYKPKYTDSELVAMAENGATANERFLVSVQPKDTSPTATLVFQRNSQLAPAWTTSFDQLEAADSDPELISKVLGAHSNFDPNKDYVMHIIDRGENLDQYGNNTIVPTWNKLGNASKNHLSKADPDLIDSVMSSEYQAEYAKKMEEFWAAGGKEFEEDQILQFASKMPESERSKFLMRHEIRTEIGANAEFTGNGLTANTAPGGGNFGVVETLTMDYNTPPLSQLQSSGTVTTIDLVPIGN